MYSNKVIIEEKHFNIIRHNVLPALFEHEDFKKILNEVCDKLAITSIIDLKEALPEDTVLTVETINEAVNNWRATVISNFQVILNEALSELYDSDRLKR